MKNESIWVKDLKEKQEPTLNSFMETDVLIIGGGLTGISAAYFLRNNPLKITVVERNRLMNGVTSKTTGKINYLQGIVYTKIKKLYNDDLASLYLDSQKEAIEIIKKVIKEEKIACNLEQVVSKVQTTTKVKELKAEFQFLKNHNVLVTEDQDDQIYGIKVSDTYVFHPLKYLTSLVQIAKQKGIQFYEETPIIDLKKENDGYLAFAANNYKIKAKKVIVACHYPFFLEPFFLPLRTYVEKSYIRANVVSEDGQYTMITTYPDILSERFLNEKDEITKLTLTNSHNICNKWNEEQNFKTLKEVYPSYMWSNEDIMTYDNIPFIGVIKENLYLATGYNTWGMTNGTIAGMMIKDFVLGKENKYAYLFNPKRKNLKGKLKQYPLNLLANTKSLLASKLTPKTKLYPKEVTIRKEKGQVVASIKDEQGSHKVTPICPHMGCTLLFNEVEKTWDCPCHASSFDLDGQCLKGPSKYNIAYHK